MPKSSKLWTFLYTLKMRTILFLFLDKVSLFAEWRMQTNSPVRLIPGSACLDVEDDRRSCYNGVSSRGSCYSPDSRPVTATLAPSYDDSEMETDW